LNLAASRKGEEDGYGVTEVGVVSLPNVLKVAESRFAADLRMPQLGIFNAQIVPLML